MLTIMKRLSISEFEVYAHTTPEDGHCMLHSIANAIYKPYRTGMRDGVPINRQTIVKEMRKEILTKLGEINKSSGRSNYETIGGGEYAKSASWNETTTPEYLKRVLSGSEQLGEEVKILLEYFIEKNILLVDSNTNKLYAKYDFNEHRSCIVIYYINLGKNEQGNDVGHFEMISVRDPKKGVHLTHFSSKDPFIQYLLRI